MHLNIEFGGEVFEASGESPVDLSIPIREKGGASAWYVDDMKVEVVRSNGFLGSVAEGGAVNFRNVTFNPHGNGTHTECLGHISPEAHSVNEVLIPAIMPCLLITVTPRNPRRRWHHFPQSVASEMRKPLGFQKTVAACHYRAHSSQSGNQKVPQLVQFQSSLFRSCCSFLAC